MMLALCGIFNDVDTCVSHFDNNLTLENCAWAGWVYSRQWWEILSLSVTGSSNSSSPTRMSHLKMDVAHFYVQFSKFNNMEMHFDFQLLPNIYILNNFCWRFLVDRMKCVKCVPWKRIWWHSQKSKFSQIHHLTFIFYGQRHFACIWMLITTCTTRTRPHEYVCAH